MILSTCSEAIKILFASLRGRQKMKKYLIVIPFILLMIGCNDENDSQNFCYILTSSDPCFDANAGGNTTVVTDQTTEEVIAEEEGMEGFAGDLNIDDILNEVAIFDPRFYGLSV